MPGGQRRPGGCGKRVFASKHQARVANRKNGLTLRAYWCELCHGWHVTKRKHPRAGFD